MGLVTVAAAALRLPLTVEAARPYCEALEAGEILALGPPPIEFTEPELARLRGGLEQNQRWCRSGLINSQAGALSGRGGAFPGVKAPCRTARKGLFTIYETASSGRWVRACSFSWCQSRMRCAGKCHSRAGFALALGAAHKNIAYRPRQDRLSGMEGAGQEAMRALMRRFSREALAFLRGFLSPYRFDADYASLRPLEEQGRPAKQKARNDLLHVDSFPTRPSRGRRILRFFVNVNASEARVWKTGPAFAELAQRMAAASGLLARYRRERGRPRLQQALVELLGRCGLAHQFRPPYDRFMLSFHDWLKARAVPE